MRQVWILVLENIQKQQIAHRQRKKKKKFAAPWKKNFRTVWKDFFMREGIYIKESGIFADGYDDIITIEKKNNV